MRIKLTLFILAVLTGWAPAQNPDLPFSSGSTGADGPLVLPTAMNAAYGFGSAYDKKRREIVRFGGSLSGSSSIAETWVMRSGGWVKLNPAQSPPAGRYLSMAYDEVREETMLFVNGETWVWNGFTWTQKSPTTSPPARTLTAMCWDATRFEILMFGGLSGGNVQLNDTWAWNGENWQQKSPVNSPGVRSGHALAYYPPLSAVAMTCGTNGPIGSISAGNYLADLWLWNGSTWSQQSSNLWPTHAIPAATLYAGYVGPSLQFSEASGELILNGGLFLYNYIGWAHGTGSNTYSWKHSRTPAVVTKVMTSALAPARWLHGAVWDSNARRLVVFGGLADTGTSGRGDTWYWMDNVWYGVTGPDYFVDTSSNPTGIWNYTSIHIPIGATVRLGRNPANTPPVWLASESVSISGTLNLNGQSMGNIAADAPIGRGAVGGFDGGEGSVSGSPAKPGGGNAGGAAGVAGAAVGGDAGATTGYVSPFGLPVMGGSGGGGAYSATNGSDGGGGGGAIVIASSKDITLNGTITATGGAGGATAPAGGSGGGGTVKLMADRIQATGGTINVTGGAGAANQGVIRLEGYTRQVTGATVTGSITQSVPTDVPVLQQAGGRLFIKTVDGQAVAAHPTANAINPDVVFTNPDPIQIVVEALNIPNGTPVTMQIKHSNGTTYNLPETGTVTLANGLATFTATVPAGSGTVQAFATYTVGQDPPVP